MSEPHLIVLFGATGDLAKRKLLPGIMHLLGSGLVPDLRLVVDDEHIRPARTGTPFSLSHGLTRPMSRKWAPGSPAGSSIIAVSAGIYALSLACYRKS